MLHKTLLVFLLGTVALCQNVSSPKIRELVEAVKTDPDAVSKFWASVKESGTPLVESYPQNPRFYLVTYLWQATNPTDEVLVSGGATASWNQAGTPLIRVAGTDVLYWTELVRDDARYIYRFALNPPAVPSSPDQMSLDELPKLMKAMAEATRKDPLVTKRPAVGSGVLIEMPGAPPQPYLKNREGIAKGTVRSREKLQSKILNQERQITLYLPPGHKSGEGDRYPVVVIFDAESYLSTVPTPRILDNMIADKVIPPTVALLVHNISQSMRFKDLACNPDFIGFLAKELLPHYRDSLWLTGDPKRTGVAGSSLGGLTAMCAGYYAPDTFGLILSQSGSHFWSPEIGFDGRTTPQTEYEANWIARQMRDSPKLPLKIHMDAGLQEVGGTSDLIPNLITANRHLRDILLLKGYPVQYYEFNGGHDYLSWRSTISDGLRYLLGN